MLWPAFGCQVLTACMLMPMYLPSDSCAPRPRADRRSLAAEAKKVSPAQNVNVWLLLLCSVHLCARMHRTFDCRMGVSSCLGGDGSLPEMPILWRGVSWLLLLLCRIPEAPYDRRLDGGLVPWLGICVAEDLTWCGVSVDSRRSPIIRLCWIRGCTQVSHDQELS